MAKRSTSPSMTPGRAVLIELMVRYCEAVLDPFVSLLEIHKLMYLMQEAGEPLRLKFEKGVYGPYAKNLRHVLNELEGHFLTGYGDAADKPELPIELLPNAQEAAAKLLSEHPETQARFDRVARLIHGFETPFGMELLSTVHWVATRESAATVAEAIQRTHSWNQRKRIFDDKQIRLGWHVLEEQGWLAR
jgi:O-acetyl-ADP-ribose deacetylase (regulator of RNase III)